MSALIHRCHYCSYNTTVPYSPSAFHRTYDCGHCGRPSPGAEAAEDSQAAMSQSQQDELAQLFAQNMNFSQHLPQHPCTPDKQFIMHESVQPQVVYSSMHYTGTSYLVPSSSPPTDMRADSPFSAPFDDFEKTFRSNNIDPASLSSSQINLFTHADYEQRLRLLELWRISPPEQGESSGGGWLLSSMAQEEELARLRYERRRSDQGRQSSMMHDHEVEPYVVSGYANSQRFDPVYAVSAGSQAPTYSNVGHSAHEQFRQTPFRSQAGDLQHDDMVM